MSQTCKKDSANLPKAKDWQYPEQQKNQLLWAVYTGDYPVVEKVYLEIAGQAAATFPWSENTEKRLNQIQAFIKRNQRLLFDNCTEHFRKKYKALKQLIVSSNRQAQTRQSNIDFNTWDKNLGLSAGQKNLVFRTVLSFQLSSGCSNFCRRCNEWALPGVRSHFTYTAVKKILTQIAGQNNSEIALYGASDPLDWEDDGKTILDIIYHADVLELNYSMLTKVPRKKHYLLKKLVEEKANVSVSVTGKNKARINQIENAQGNPLNKQHDLEELLIPAGLDEDFVSVKPSITDGYGTEITPDGAFIIIPTFTSALHPFGHQKIKITRDTDFFPVKKNGRQALLVDYFKPLEGYNAEGIRHFRQGLLDVQIETILLDNGDYELTPPGMRSVEEYLSIFDGPARRRRKQMTPTIFRGLKQEYLSQTSFKALPQETKFIYLKQIRRHMDLCDKDKCLAFKRNTISFFLEAVQRYRLHNDAKMGVIHFLLKDELNAGFKTFGWIQTSVNLTEQFSGPAEESFALFRYCLFCLITHKNMENIQVFIQKNSARYDPVSDLFVRPTSQKGAV